MDHKRILMINLVAVFVIILVYIIITNLRQYHTLYLPSPDGDLYLSIANNFLNSGHFIETTRNGTFVPPPVLPLFFMLLKIVTNNVNIFVVFAYITFAFTAVLLFWTSYNLFSSYFVSVLCVLLFVLNPLLTQFVPIYSTLTETYAIFLYVLMMFIISLDKYDWLQKLYLVYPVIIIAFFMRPHFMGILMMVLGAFIIMTIMKKMSIKRCVLLCLLPMILLGINAGINFRTTGQYIILENYSGFSLYLANNENTKSYEYKCATDADAIREFADETYKKIFYDNSLSWTEKNNLLKSKAVKYIIHNIGRTILNTKEKFVILFIGNYGWMFYLSLISAIWLFYKYNKIRIIVVAYWLSFFAVTILTSLGLNIPRYSILSLPIYTVFVPALYGECFKMVSIWYRRFNQYIKM